jgi:hypothetical protein
MIAIRTDRFAAAEPRPRRAQAFDPGAVRVAPRATYTGSAVAGRGPVKPGADGPAASRAAR